MLTTKVDLAYKLSYIITGAMASLVLIKEHAYCTGKGLYQIPFYGGLLWWFVAACFFQITYMYWQNRDNLSKGASDFALHLTIAMEVVIAVNIAGILSTNVFVIPLPFVRDLVINRRETTFYGAWKDCRVWLYLCVIYQFLYCRRTMYKKESDARIRRFRNAYRRIVRGSKNK